MDTNFNEFNKRILEKLENKIAISELKEKENIKRTTKTIPFIGAKVAAIVTIMGFVSGNAYTYATYNKDLISTILDKIGIFEKYNQESTEVNITKVDNGHILTLENYAIDGETLIVGYSLKLQELSERETIIENMYDITTLISGDETIELDSEKFQLFNKIGDNEYAIYKFYTVDLEKLTDNMILNTDIQIYKYDKETYEPYGPNSIWADVGNWNFSVNIPKDIKSINYERYYAVNKIAEAELLDTEEWQGGMEVRIPMVELLEVRQSDIITKFILDVKSYSTNVVYCVEILDENNNVILEDGLQYITGGFPEEIVAKKIETNSKIKINVYEYEWSEEYSNGFKVSKGEKCYSKATIELDMANELKTEPIVGNKKIKWKDLEFELENYDFNSNEYYDNTNVKSVASFYTDVSIHMAKYKNENNMDLETLLQKIAIEGSVYVDAEIELKDIKNIKIDGIDAITGLQIVKRLENDRMYRYYIFLKEEYVYEIYYPEYGEDSSSIDLFLNSIRIVD